MDTLDLVGAMVIGASGGALIVASAHFERWSLFWLGWAVAFFGGAAWIGFA